jgi:hypothetical protein
MQGLTPGELPLHRVATISSAALASPLIASFASTCCNAAFSSSPQLQALHHAQQQLAASTSDSLKREVDTLRSSLAQAQAELSLGSRDQLNQELITCRSALESASADNERMRAAHKASMDACISEAQGASNEAAAAAAKITRLQHELSQVKRDLAEAAPKAQRCADAERASQADEMKAVAAAAAADAAAAAAREAKDAQRQLQQELHDEQRRSSLMSQDVEYLRQATARLESNNAQLRDKCERQSARIQKLKAHEEELQVISSMSPQRRPLTLVPRLPL